MAKAVVWVTECRWRDWPTTAPWVPDPVTMTTKGGAERRARDSRSADRAWNNKRVWRVAQYARVESSVAPKRKGVSRGK